MKKAIIICFLLALPIFSLCQTGKTILQFRSTEGHMSAMENGSWSAMKDMSEEDGKGVLIVFDVFDNYIKIYDKTPTKLTIYGDIYRKSDKNPDIETFTFHCIDPDGTECKIIQNVFPNNPGVYVITLEYPKIKVLYKCKIQP